jgi:hypothetical protein
MPDKKYWTDEYQEKKGFVVFETKTQKGTIQKHQIRKDLVNEITEMEGKLEGLDKPADES